MKKCDMYRFLLGESFILNLMLFSINRGYTKLGELFGGLFFTTLVLMLTLLIIRKNKKKYKG